MAIPGHGLNVLKYNQQHLNRKFFALGVKRNFSRVNKDFRDSCSFWQKENLICAVKKQHYKYESRVDWAKMVRISKNTIFVIGGKQKGMLSASN